jgi:putative ABC transport system ATP-binding protein
MSVGQRQKVAIARALVTQPKVIFADEPTASLDHQNAHLIMEVLANLKGQTTILIATHDHSILEPTDRIIQMWDGRIIKTTSLSEIAELQGQSV